MSVINSAQLQKADADPIRLEAEAIEFERDPEAYIDKHYRRLVDWDFPLFCRLFVKITTKDGRLVPFILNRVQRQLWRWLIEDLASGKPVRWFIVKARQQGVSTLVLVFFYWLTSQRSTRNGLVLTHDESSVQNFNSRVRSLHAEVHPLLQSPTITNNRELLHFGTTTAERKKGKGAGLDSRLVFAPAKTAELGRSWNYQYALLSEFCIWPEVKPPIDVDDKMVSLNQAISELPGTIIIKEATPKGLNRTAEIWSDPTNGYRKLFIPWVAFDEYRLPLLPNEELKLCGAEEISGQQTRYGNEIEESRLIAAALREWYPDEVAAGGKGWIEKEIPARLNWRRYYIDKKCAGSKTKFRQEYPTTASHGFMATSKNVFDFGSLELLRAHVEEEGIQPRRYRYIHDPENENLNEKFQFDEFGPLAIYEPPQVGGLYVIGGDAGMGVPNSGDPSALMVLKVSDDLLEEVASYNQIITPDKFAELAYYLGLLFNKALLGIENNERGGYAANLKLHREMKYPRMYFKYDAYDKNAAPIPGFVTKPTNKSVLVTGLEMRIRDHEILLRSPLLIGQTNVPEQGQLFTYMDLGDGELGASPGHYDDLVSATLIATHLSTKVHQFIPRDDPPPGSIGHFMKHGDRRSNRQLLRR